MMDTQTPGSELTGLEFLYLQECVRIIHVGKFHTVSGAVVQLLAMKRNQTDNN